MCSSSIVAALCVHRGKFFTYPSTPPMLSSPTYTIPKFRALPNVLQHVSFQLALPQNTCRRMVVCIAFERNCRVYNIVPVCRTTVTRESCPIKRAFHCRKLEPYTWKLHHLLAQPSLVDKILCPDLLPLSLAMQMLIVQWKLLSQPRSSFTLSSRCTIRPLYFCECSANSECFPWLSALRVTCALTRTVETSQASTFPNCSHLSHWKKSVYHP